MLEHQRATKRRQPDTPHLLTLMAPTIASPDPASPQTPATL